MFDVKYANMLRGVKRSAVFVSAVLFAPFLRLIQGTPVRVVIMYHGIDESDVSGFRRQMAYLSEKCFVVEPSRITTAHPAEKVRTLVSIVFDDAYVSVLKNALPILKSYRLLFGVSVPTGHIGRRPTWSTFDDSHIDEEMVMTEQQIRKLDRDGAEILSHTVTHAILTGLEDDELQAELAESKGTLEKIVGHKVSGLAYPYGVYDTRVCDAARRAGYKCAFTVEPEMVGRRPEGMEIGRFEVLPGDEVQFRLKLSGAYQVKKYLQRLKRRLCWRT